VDPLRIRGDPRAVAAPESVLSPDVSGGGTDRGETDVSIDAQSPTSGRVTAARIVATLGVLGATAAIASLGTFGSFSDTTTPVDTTVDSGVVSIDVAQAGAGLVPFTGGLMLPGDTRTFPVDLVNSGNTALSSVTLGSWATASSALDSDPVNGLQLKVDSCSQAWASTGSGYSCAGTQKAFYSGRMLVQDHTVAGAASLAAGAVDHLLLTAALPSTASAEDFEGATSSLSFVFTGTQRGSASR
jgi:hypothetical protein